MLKLLMLDLFSLLMPRLACVSGSPQDRGTVGAVDLGGSSLEVSFVPNEPIASESQGAVLARHLLCNLHRVL